MYVQPILPGHVEITHFLISHFTQLRFTNAVVHIYWIMLVRSYTYIGLFFSIVVIPLYQIFELIFELRFLVLVPSSLSSLALPSIYVVSSSTIHL